MEVQISLLTLYVKILQETLWPNQSNLQKLDVYSCAVCDMTLIDHHFGPLQAKPEGHKQHRNSRSTSICLIF